VALNLLAIFNAVIVGIVFVMTNPPAIDKLSCMSIITVGLMTSIIIISRFVLERPLEQRRTSGGKAPKSSPSAQVAKSGEKSSGFGTAVPRRPADIGFEETAALIPTSGNLPVSEVTIQHPPE
jgi:hypothetical protein